MFHDDPRLSFVNSLALLRNWSLWSDSVARTQGIRMRLTWIYLLFRNHRWSSIFLIPSRLLTRRPLVMPWITVNICHDKRDSIKNSFTWYLIPVSIVIKLLRTRVCIDQANVCFLTYCFCILQLIKSDKLYPLCYDTEISFPHKFRSNSRWYEINSVENWRLTVLIYTRVL